MCTAFPNIHNQGYEEIKGGKQGHKLCFCVDNNCMKTQFRVSNRFSYGIILIFRHLVILIQKETFSAGNRLKQYKNIQILYSSAQHGV